MKCAANNILLMSALLPTAFLVPPSLPAADPVHPLPAIQDTETKAQRDARLAWWREARFGMFIHWGVYAQPMPVGEGEWAVHNHKIPAARYKELAKAFNPTKFDADAWVALAKSAGMKYIVLTTKHHDGFALFDSKADPFNIVDATPYKRDPLKELAAACQRQGLKLGFYYSQDQDWTAPGGAVYKGRWDEAQNGNFAEYLDKKAIPQIEELLTNYQPYPAILWFDYPTEDVTPELAAKVVKVLNQHPNLFWNDRLGGGYHGDNISPEQHIPPQGYPGKDWETCMTISANWAFRPRDHVFKSTETLLRNLIEIASKGGNYPLNVGPDAEGVIPLSEVDRLTEVSGWRSTAKRSTAAGRLLSPNRMVPMCRDNWMSTSIHFGYRRGIGVARPSRERFSFICSNGRARRLPCRG